MCEWAGLDRGRPRVTTAAASLFPRGCLGVGFSAPFTLAGARLLSVHGPVADAGAAGAARGAQGWGAADSFRLPPSHGARGRLGSWGG